jgi:Family of unknown function (DUF6361)
MSVYEPASSLGWLDLDAAASERVANLLRALEEPGTLDPLGLGSVRDTFSAMLSPGTSTIQTRLRYFIFLPWIFSTLQSQGVAPGDFARRLRDSEARLIECLRPLGSNQGVIGFAAGRNLKRFPSETYWGGLGSWGLRRLDLSLAEYAKRAAAFGRQRPDRDDEGNVTTASVAMWVSMPPPPDDFLDAEITFELRRSEAQLLTDHIRQRRPRSLLAALCDSPELAVDASFPWDIPKTVLLPEHLRDILRHAQCFSELTVGPQHVYNVLLARKARAEFGWETEELESSEVDHLNAWVELIAQRHDELRTWVAEISEFWAVLAPYDTVSPRTQEFVETIVTRALVNPAGLANDASAHTIIRNREILLKTKRARLGHRSALESWNQAPFGGQLNYRWPITRSYLADIARGMARSA